MFTCDHGDMLGNHGLWAKPCMYESVVRIPMILVPTSQQTKYDCGVKDGRLAELRDVMPTLLDMCGIPIPESVEGHSLVSDKKRDYLYCEHYEDERKMRMIRTNSHKLIYYPVGNVYQLFDLVNDPNELVDLSGNCDMLLKRKN